VTPPQVVNRHHYRRTGLPRGARYIGRGTPLGNPYTVAEHGSSALELYRKWLWKKIRQRDVAVMEEMRRIKPGDLLVCSCKPRPCHGDVVVAAWTWMRREGLLGSDPVLSNAR